MLKQLGLVDRLVPFWVDEQGCSARSGTFFWSQVLLKEFNDTSLDLAVSSYLGPAGRHGLDLNGLKELNDKVLGLLVAIRRGLKQCKHT